MLRLYNTLTKKKEEFKPLNPPVVTYYSCGPTVYDYAHIGHARTYVFADILQRALEFNGYKVKRAMNITDVGHLTSDADSGEDKMEEGAKREKKSVWEIAEFYTDDFMVMLNKLNIKKPEIICRATDHLASMIYIIEVLEKKGFTYKTEDGIYFDTSKFPDYGILTGQSFEKLQKTLKGGVRVEKVPGKKNITDFALWKFSYPHGRSFDFAQDDVASRRQMEWDSPWGKGFPGWHIECSSMSMEYLGETIDIHTGGVDHIQIHHTNEIAQSEAATGKPFVRFWLHAGHLLVDGQKMSKSLGNFYRLKDLKEKGFDLLSLRLLFLNSTYRQEMNFTWKSMKAAQNAFDSLKDYVLGIKEQMARGERISLSREKEEKISQFRQKFIEVVNDNLNTSQALAILWEVVKNNIPPTDKHDLLTLFDEVLGLGIDKMGRKRIEIPEEIEQLIEERDKLRAEKKFQEADEIRKKIEEKDYYLEDTPDGTVVRQR